MPEESIITTIERGAEHAHAAPNPNNNGHVPDFVYNLPHNAVSVPESGGTLWLPAWALMALWAYVGWMKWRKVR